MNECIRIFYSCHFARTKTEALKRVYSLPKVIQPADLWQNQHVTPGPLTPRPVGCTPFCLCSKSALASASDCFQRPQYALNIHGGGKPLLSGLVALMFAVLLMLPGTLVFQPQATFLHCSSPLSLLPMAMEHSLPCIQSPMLPAPGLCLRCCLCQQRVPSFTLQMPALHSPCFMFFSQQGCDL